MKHDGWRRGWTTIQNSTLDSWFYCCVCCVRIERCFGCARLRANKDNIVRVHCCCCCCCFMLQGISKRYRHHDIYVIPYTMLCVVTSALHRCVVIIDVNSIIWVLYFVIYIFFIIWIIIICVAVSLLLHISTHSTLYMSICYIHSYIYIYTQHVYTYILIRILWIHAYDEN